MERRGIKRKMYEVIKNDMSVELHKLTVESANYNNDVRAATEDFEQMFKSMSDRQDDFKTRSLLLEEQYRATIAILKEDRSVKGGDSVGGNIDLPQSYAQDAKKFANDSNTSLKGHGEFLTKEYEDMEKSFLKFEKVWKENMEDMKRRAEQIDMERSKLSSALHVFVRKDPEDSDEEDD